MKSRISNRAVKAAVAFVLLAATIAYAQSGWSGKKIGSGGKDINAVYFADSKRGWVGGDDGFFSMTEDGGATWIERRIGTDHAINDIHFTSKETGFVVAGPSIFATGDGGHSWRESKKFELQDATAELYSLRFNGKKRGWVVGSASHGDDVVNSIFASTRDGGSSWEVLQAPTKRELIHIDFVDDKHGWIVGAGGTIMHTDDAGETWTTQKSGTTNTIFHIDFRNEHLGWAVGEKGTILLTSDGGLTWSEVKSPVKSTLLGVQFVNSEDGWIVGRGGVILRSEDGGRSWVQQESTTKANLYALYFEKKNGWAVGGDGTILRYER
jgi:photosystem II stability/assembly factor-like uncharacterized protein